MKTILSLCLAAFVLVGCQGRLTIDLDRQADGSTNVTVGISEQDVNSTIRTALSNSQDPFIVNPVVDLQSGRIVITGQIIDRNGQQVPGSLEFTARAASGELIVEVIEADYAGYDASDVRIAEINQQIAASLGQRARQGRQSDATLTDVSITNDALSITVNIPPRR